MLEPINPNPIIVKFNYIAYNQVNILPKHQSIRKHTFHVNTLTIVHGMHYWIVLFRTHDTKERTEGNVIQIDENFLQHCMSTIKGILI